jgi:hypothetical protein
MTADTAAPSVREALETERAELMAKNEAATSWGAAVGARCERIKDIDRQLRALSATPTPTEARERIADIYLVWSNEHAAWWGPNRCGYNTHISHAGRYTRDEAIKICNGARGGREFNRNPSEVPILLKDAEAFWTEAGLQERYEREARDLDNDLCDGDFP